MRPTPPPGRGRIVILGWYGSDNAGDEAVLTAVVEALRARGFTDLCALSTDPTRTAARLGIRSAPRSLLNALTRKELSSASALVLGGGGLIQDGTSVYNLPIYAAFVAAARARGLYVIGWGLGVEPLNTRLGKLLARYIIRSSDHFSVRDQVSLQLLRRAGVSTQNVIVSADPAFLIEPGAPQPNTGGRPLVMFCIRHLSDNHPGINAHYLLPVSVRYKLGLGWRPDPVRRKRFISGLARALVLCTGELGATVGLLPFWPGRDDEMLQIVRQEAIKIGASEDSVVIEDGKADPAALAGRIAQADLLVSMRLHALIFAAGQGVPSLGLSYARKVRGLMRSLGRERWVVEVETRTPPPEEIEMKLRSLWAQREQESVAISAAARAAAARAVDDADKIAELLRA